MIHPRELDLNGLSYYEISLLFGVSEDCIKSWFSGRRSPSGSAYRLAEIYKNHPVLIESVLSTLQGFNSVITI